MKESDIIIIAKELIKNNEFNDFFILKIKTKGIVYIEENIIYAIKKNVQLYKKINKTISLNKLVNKDFEILNEKIISMIDCGISYDQREGCYIRNDVEIVRINCLSDYINVLNMMNKNSFHMYRGHSNLEYELLPSIFRNTETFKNETNNIKDIIMRFPEVFSKCLGHLDYLTIMQHYGLSTRLLDLTTNPLVALYFAACSNEDKIGEVVVFEENKDNIKSYDSDTIELLANLPFLKTKDKATLYNMATNSQHLNAMKDPCIKHMYHSIKSEKCWFDDSQDVLRLDDLITPRFVFVKQNNARVINQKGMFLIFGLTEKDIDNKSSVIKSLHNAYNKTISINGKYIKILIYNKKRILDELENLNINESFIYPEIEHYTKYVLEGNSKDRQPNKRTLVYKKIICRKCGKEHLICWIDNNGKIITPTDFNKEEIIIAKGTGGIRIAENTYNKKEIYNICECGAIYGNSYLIDAISTK